MKKNVLVAGIGQTNYIFQLYTAIAPRHPEFNFNTINLADFVNTKTTLEAEKIFIKNQNLPKKIQISETIIYNRLADKKFNQNNLRGQTLDNQVSKFNSYDVNINIELKEKIEALFWEPAYVPYEFVEELN